MFSKKNSLYLVIDSLRRTSQFDADIFFSTIREALLGGVDIVQFRDKGAIPARYGELEFREQAAIITDLKQLCGEYDALCAVNDRADLAYAVEADIIHLGQKDMSVTTARDLLGSEIVIGQSCHTADQVDAAIDNPAVDYFCTGPVWATPTKPGREAVGLDLVRYAAQAQKRRENPMPFFAIGGIDIDNAQEVYDAGARAFVVVRAIAHAENPRQSATELKRILQPEGEQTEKEA